MVIMETMAVGELKAHFSQVVEDVKNGEEVIVSYGKKHESVAVLIPYSTYRKKNRIRLGLLQDQGTAEFMDDFKMTAEQMASSYRLEYVGTHEDPFDRLLIRQCLQLNLVFLTGDAQIRE